MGGVVAGGLTLGGGNSGADGADDQGAAPTAGIDVEPSDCIVNIPCLCVNGSSDGRRGTPVTTMATGI